MATVTAPIDKIEELDFNTVFRTAPLWANRKVRFEAEVHDIIGRPYRDADELVLDLKAPNATEANIIRISIKRSEVGDSLFMSAIRELRPKDLVKVEGTMQEIKGKNDVPIVNISKFTISKKAPSLGLPR